MVYVCVWYDIICYPKIEEEVSLNANLVGRKTSVPSFLLSFSLSFSFYTSRQSTSLSLSLSLSKLFWPNTIKHHSLHSWLRSCNPVRMYFWNNHIRIFFLLFWFFPSTTFATSHTHTYTPSPMFFLCLSVSQSLLLSFHSYVDAT